jgi:hypothetical protein
MHLRIRRIRFSDPETGKLQPMKTALISEPFLVAYHETLYRGKKGWRHTVQYNLLITELQTISHIFRFQADFRLAQAS